MTTPPPSPPFCNPSKNTAPSLPSPRTSWLSVAAPHAQTGASRRAHTDSSPCAPRSQVMQHQHQQSRAAPAAAPRPPRAPRPGPGTRVRHGEGAGGSAAPEPRLPSARARYRERQRPRRGAELSLPGTHRRQPRRCRRGDEEVPAPLPPPPGVTRGTANAQGGPGPRRAQGGPGISFPLGRGTEWAQGSWRNPGLAAGARMPRELGTACPARRGCGALASPAEQITGRSKHSGNQRGKLSAFQNLSCSK